MQRMKTSLFAAALLVCVLGCVLGCNARTDRTDGGGVLLSVSQLSLPPTQFSVSSTTLPFVGTLVIQNIVKDPTATLTGPLENVELSSFEVVYSRADTGKRVPPPLVAKFGGVVPVNGTLSIGNLTVMSNNQLSSLPLSDLVQFGVDRETNSTRIVLNLSIRFFGRTLSGKEVQTVSTGFTMEVSQ